MLPLDDVRDPGCKAAQADAIDNQRNHHNHHHHQSDNLSHHHNSGYHHNGGGNRPNNNYPDVTDGGYSVISGGNYF